MENNTRLLSPRNDNNKIARKEENVSTKINGNNLTISEQQQALLLHVVVNDV